MVGQGPSSEIWQRGFRTSDVKLHTRLALKLLLCCWLTAGGGATATSADTAELALWEGADLQMVALRVARIDLGGGAVTAERLQQGITRAALEDLDTDRVLLRKLIIGNGRVLGPLSLTELTVPFALTFEDLSFAALDLTNMHFEQRLTFDRVSWHRRLYIDKSEFDRGLFFGQGCRFANETGGSTFMNESSLSKPVLQLHKTMVQRDLSITGTEFLGSVALFNNRVESALRIDGSRLYGALRLRDNSFGNLDLYRTDHNGELDVFSNNIERLEIKGSTFFDRIRIDQNFISDYVVIADINLAPKQRWPTPAVELTGNDVSKEFRFSASYVSSLVDEIGVVANTLRGKTVFEIPAQRLDAGRTVDKEQVPGAMVARADAPARSGDPAVSARAGDPGAWWQPVRLNVQNSNFDATLVVKLGLASRAAKPEGLEQYCYSRDSASSDRLLEIDFGSSQVGRLDWQLPIGDCAYQWRGGDFLYQRWVGSEQEQKQWIYQLAAPHPSTIFYVAEHLRAAGNFERSRDLFYEAKRISYEPRSTGDFATCSWDVAPWSSFSCVRQYVLYLYLTASGFGVKPELTVVCLAATWALGLVVYVLYSWSVRARERVRPLVVVPAWFDRLLDTVTRATLVRRGPKSSLPAPTAHQLDEAPARFAGASFRHRFMGPAPAREPRPPAGFALHESKKPEEFSLWVFSLDATLPVIDLHAYTSYYPEAYAIQLFSYFQHILGWLFVSSLIASLAVL